MKISSLIWLALAIAVLVSLISVWFYPSDQDFMTSNNTWNGIKDFSRQFNLINLDSLEGLSAPAENDVLICIPYLEYNASDLARIKSFVDRGGHLLLMDDFGFGNEILSGLGSGIRFDHNLLLDPLFCYKNQYLPRITHFSSEMDKSGITEIGLNHATVLYPEDKSQALAWSSTLSYLDINNNGEQDPDEPSGPFAVAASFGAGQGKVTLVSDPSLIINAMTELNGNTAFMRNLLSSEGQTGQIFLDRSHLEKSRLDLSRNKLDSFRRVFSSPYIILGLIALLFIPVVVYTLRKGEIFGQ